MVGSLESPEKSTELERP